MRLPFCFTGRYMWLAISLRATESRTDASLSWKKHVACPRDIHPMAVIEGMAGTQL